MDKNKLDAEIETYFTPAEQASTLPLQENENNAIIDVEQNIMGAVLNQSNNDEASPLCYSGDCESDCDCGDCCDCQECHCEE